MKPRILVIGDVCTELNVVSGAFPNYMGICEAENYDSVLGGSGIHSALSLARLGADSILCSVTGDDANRREMVSFLSEEGVDVRFLNKVRGENTAVDIILKSENDERKISYKGVISRFAQSFIDEAFISYPDGVILHGAKIPPVVIDETVKQAKKQGTPLIISGLPDPSGYPISKIGECEILVVDSSSAYRCTGIRPADQEKCMKACIALMQRIKAKYIIIRLEERGSFIYDGTYYSFVSSYDVDVNENTNSIHAFTSALVCEYLSNEKNIKHACDFATVVSAAYISAGAALRSYPRLEDVKRFAIRNEIEFDS